MACFGRYRKRSQFHFGYNPANRNGRFGDGIGRQHNRIFPAHEQSVGGRSLCVEVNHITGIFKPTVIDAVRKCNR